MRHYDYQARFKRLYDKAVRLYGQGNRDRASYFDADELSFIAANGWRVQDFYDYAEDFVSGEEPSYEIAQSIEQARREYFLHVQDSQASDRRISVADLPAKSEAIDGIEWLPRIVQKAIGKLKGELPDEIMYCCGGDRRFLKTHDLHPSEFLRAVWANLDDLDGVVKFVKERSHAAGV